MAYLVPIDQECADGSCVKRATVEVRNNRNEVMARYCKRHGEALVKRLNEG